MELKMESEMKVRPRCINIFARFLDNALTVQWSRPSLIMCSVQAQRNSNFFGYLSHMAAAHENCQMHWNVARQSTRKIIKLSNGARSKWSSWSLKNGVKTVGMNTIDSLTGNFNFEAHRKRFLLQLNCNSLSTASFSNEIMENLIKPNEQ